MHITVFATDLDGTLATNGMVEAETWQALRDAKQAGITLMLVTGRALQTFTPGGAYAEVFDAIVAEDGAVVYFPHRDVVVLPFGQLDPFLIAQFEQRAIPLERGMAIAATRVPHDAAVLEVLRHSSGGATVEYNRGAVMMLPAGATKGTGLQYALRELGCSPRNVVAVGDAENDRSLFEVAELSVAVANATPELQSLADVVLPEANGTGTRSLLADLQSGHIRRYQSRPSRHLLLGQRADGAPVRLDPFMFVDGNVGILGNSGGGKSWLAGAIAEALLKQHYQLCLIDPEGDYRGLRAFPHTLLLGGSGITLPPVSDVITMLEYADLSLVVDLSLYQPDERARYAAHLVQELRYLRARRGRPHWLLVDEVQNFCPAGASDVVTPLCAYMQHGGVCVVSYRPSQVMPDILRHIDRWLLTRFNQPEEIAALAPYVANNAAWPALQAQLAGLPFGQAILCANGNQDRESGCVGAGNDTLIFRSGPRTVPHIRHLHKYLRTPLPSHRRFYFCGNDGRSIQQAAASLWEFRVLLQSIPLDSLQYHLQRGDFERWVASVFRDGELARRLGKLARRDLAGESLRQALLAVVRDRYDELDSLV